MGIPGLLGALKPYASVQGNVRQFDGQAIAVDASSWLHKSVYAIADHYVECIEREPNSSNNQYRLDEKCIAMSASYMMKRCDALIRDKARIAKVYLVMDGKRCPLKAVTNEERERVRQQHLQAARQLQRQYQHELQRSQQQDSQKQQPSLQKYQAAMFEKYKACIKVIPELVTRVMERVQQRFASSYSTQNMVELVWSPYEADAQLVQLAIDGRVNAIITEDSDVLVYSAAAQFAVPILYKVDRETLQCDICSMDWLLTSTLENGGGGGAITMLRHGPNRPARSLGSTSMANRSSSTNHNTNNNNSNGGVHDKKNDGAATSQQLEAVLHILVARQEKSPGWGARLFVQACVLAGCDYAPRGQLPGVGLVTAFKYVRLAGLTGSPSNLQSVFASILQSQLPTKSRAAVPDLAALERLLAQSEAVFYYHPVSVLVPGHHGRSVLSVVTHLNDAHDPAKHAPVLTRFGTNLDFLGVLEANPLAIAAASHFAATATTTTTTGRPFGSGIIPPHILQRQRPTFFKRNVDASLACSTSTTQHQPHQQYQQQQARPPSRSLHPQISNIHNGRASYDTSVTSPSSHQQQQQQQPRRSRVDENDKVQPAPLHPPHRTQKGMLASNPYHTRRIPFQPKGNAAAPLSAAPVARAAPNHPQSSLPREQPKEVEIVTEVTPANVFEAYAQRHREPGNLERIHKIVTAKLPVRRKRHYDGDNDDHLNNEQHAGAEDAKIYTSPRRKRRLESSLADNFDSFAAKFGAARAADNDNDDDYRDESAVLHFNRNLSGSRASRGADGAWIAPRSDKDRDQPWNGDNHPATKPPSRNRQDCDAEQRPATKAKIHISIGSLQTSTEEVSRGMGAGEGLYHEDGGSPHYDDQPTVAISMRNAPPSFYDLDDGPWDDSHIESSPDLMHDMETHQIESQEMLSPLKSSPLDDDPTTRSAYFGGQRCKLPSSSPIVNDHNDARRVTLEQVAGDSENPAMAYQCAEAADPLAMAMNAPLYDSTTTENDNALPMAADPLYSVYDFEDNVPMQQQQAQLQNDDVVNLCGPGDGEEMATSETDPYDPFSFLPSSHQSRLRSDAAPKEKSTIGPAKTFRIGFGFGGVREATSKLRKKQSIIHKFIRQNTRVSGNGRHDSTQTSLFQHFPRR